MGWSVMRQGLLAVFKFKVTVRAYIIRYDCFHHIYWTADLSAIKCKWMVLYHKLECFVQKLDCCFQGQGHSEGFFFFKALCISYVLYHWSLGNQIGCADSLFLIAKPVQQSGHILTVTLSFSVSRGIQRREGEGAILPCKATNRFCFFVVVFYSVNVIRDLQLGKCYPH